jgi:hypothetical protein
VILTTMMMTSSLPRRLGDWYCYCFGKLTLSGLLEEFVVKFIRRSICYVIGFGM